jgi:hypothetical protein
MTIFRLWGVSSRCDKIMRSIQKRIRDISFDREQFYLTDPHEVRSQENAEHPRAHAQSLAFFTCSGRSVNCSIVALVAYCGRPPGASEPLHRPTCQLILRDHPSEHGGLEAFNKCDPIHLVCMIKSGLRHGPTGTARRRRGRRRRAVARRGRCHGRRTCRTRWPPRVRSHSGFRSRGMGAAMGGDSTAHGCTMVAMGGRVIKRPPLSARAQSQLWSYISLGTCRWRMVGADSTE